MEKKEIYQILKIVTLVVFMAFFSFTSNGQQKEGGIKFHLACDSLKTMIVTEASIMVYIIDDQTQEMHFAERYCRSTFFHLPPGNYSIIIESPKFCTEEIKKVAIQSEKLTFIELNLKRERDPDCLNERNYTPPKSTSCG